MTRAIGVAMKRDLMLRHRALGLLLLAAAVRPVVAQKGALADESWQLDGSGGSYCIWYLADPELARKIVPESTSLLPAGAGGDLPKLLVNTIKDEPRFAQWIPGSICIGFYNRVTTSGRTIAEAKAGRPIMIATNSVAAQGAHGVPEANLYLIDFATNDRNVASAADDLGVGMSDIKLSQRQRLEQDDPNITIDFAGLQINWAGHPVADSSVGTTRTMSFGYGGPKSLSWQITQTTSPRYSRAMVAVLWIDGRNDLAKVLKASPVRAIGPFESIGTGTLTFHAVTKH
jgi:hypothetical protein